MFADKVEQGISRILFREIRGVRDRISTMLVDYRTISIFARPTPHVIYVMRLTDKEENLSGIPTYCCMPIVYLYCTTVM